MKGREVLLYLALCAIICSCRESNPIQSKIFRESSIIDSASPYVDIVSIDIKVDSSISTSDILSIKEAYLYRIDEYISIEMAESNAQELVNLTHRLNINVDPKDINSIILIDELCWLKQKSDDGIEDVYIQFQLGLKRSDNGWISGSLQFVSEIESPQPYSSSWTLPNYFSNFQGINYSSRDAGRKDFWKNYDKLAVEVDLRKVRAIGIDIVRVALPDIADLDLQTLELNWNKIDHFFAVARKNNLLVIPVVFSQRSLLGLKNYTAYDRYVEAVLKRYRDYSNILVWDFFDTPDREIDESDMPMLVELISFLLDRSRTYTRHPFTITWCHSQSLDVLVDKLDVVSVIYRDDANNLEQFISDLDTENLPPLFISDYLIQERHEEDQLRQQKAIINTLDQHQLIGMSHSLFDLIEEGRNKRMTGLLRYNGSPRAMVELYKD